MESFLTNSFKLARVRTAAGGSIGVGGMGAGGGCGVGLGLGWGFGAAWGAKYLVIEAEFESQQNKKPRWFNQLRDVVATLQMTHPKTAAKQE